MRRTIKHGGMVVAMIVAAVSAAGASGVPEPRNWQELSKAELLFKPEWMTRQDATKQLTFPGDPVISSRPAPPRGLVGRRLLIDSSHGRTWNEERNWWGWQRDNVFGEVEDLITPRMVNRWLIPYLQNAGAYVFTTRERDEQLIELRLDETAGTGTSHWQPFNSADSWQGAALEARTTATHEGAARFTWNATIPRTDRYGLCIRFPAGGTNRAADARYIVHTAAGDVPVLLSQATNQGLWLFIDWFIFAEGTGPVVTLEGVSTTGQPGTTIIADAIRLGGGMGDWAPGGEVSGLPRWQEYSKSYAAFYGAPQWVWDSYVVGSDVWVRRDMADWLGANYFLELHTNADGAGTGTQSGYMTYFTTSPSQEVQDVFRWGHQHMLETLRARWLPTFRDAQFLNASVSPFQRYPHELIELAFHDRLDPDQHSLLDPDFRAIAMRALYEKIARLVGGPEVVFLPEPPTAPAVRNAGGGAVVVSWLPPALGPAVDRYRVYTSRDGLAFEPFGTDVGTAVSLRVEGLAPGDVRYFQIVAENDGGRSVPTEVVGVRVGDGTPVLVVNGFDRLDRHVQEPDNPRHFVRQHLAALAAADPDIAVDSCANEAFAGTESVRAAFWILGKEMRVPLVTGVDYTNDRVFTAEEQQRVAAFLAAGGRLFASGSNIMRDLVTNGSAADRDFAQRKLFAGFDAGRTTTRTAAGTAGGPFAGVSLELSGRGELPYFVDESDVMSRGLSGDVVLQWTGGAPAGLAYAGGPGKVLLLATPLEAIKDSATRTTIAQRALAFLDADPTPDTTGPVIANPFVANIGPDTATIRWETDEPATGAVVWGVEGGSTTTTNAPGAEERGKAVTLTGLQPATRHVYTIIARDVFGNESTSAQAVFTTAEPETDPPVISGARVVGLSDRDAIIQFRTNEPARAALDWGPNGQVSQRVTGGSDLARLHVLAIRGLSPNTSYTVRPEATDASGNVGRGDTFTLLTLPTIQPVIVDNSDPGFSIIAGPWTVATSAAGRYGADYAFTSTTNTTAEVRWIATLPTRGNWQAAAQFPAGANRTPNANYRLITADATANAVLSQQQNGGVFNNLGTAQFHGTTAGEVRLVVAGSQPTVVMADAIRWTFVNLGPESAWLQDDEATAVEWILY